MSVREQPYFKELSVNIQMLLLTCDELTITYNRITDHLFELFHKGERKVVVGSRCLGMNTSFSFIAMDKDASGRALEYFGASIPKTIVVENLAQALTLFKCYKNLS